MDCVIGEDLHGSSGDKSPCDLWIHQRYRVGLRKSFDRSPLAIHDSVRPVGFGHSISSKTLFRSRATMGASFNST